MIQTALDRLSIALAGAVLGLLLAEYGYGVQGLEKPENLAYGALVLTLGALGIVRMTAAKTPMHNSETQ
ncbi:hypothetical protein [Sphingopyxis terrae]|uniref:hypothetical protein n=1 Tax=Sphingopyxis terrae TaxID=33052 RepID=UPI0007877A48|nr:hypothetical protein [Sphingopyxis terrae]